MSQYTRLEAREWARENLHGLANVVIPSFSQDLTKLNEKGIRHDVRRCMELGFTGTLLVAETATTLEEYNQFTKWAVDEAKGKLTIIHHAAFNTLEENIQAVQAAEEAGAALVLLSYPANFYPKDSQEIYQYTKAFAESTNLGIVLFPVPLWGFERLHPAAIDPKIIRQLLDDVPNIVAIKAEGGMPLIAGFTECYQLFNDEVIVTTPLEKDAFALGNLVPIQWMGTSNYEMYGDVLPKLFNLMKEGRVEEVYEQYWKLQPARSTIGKFMASSDGAGLVNRMLWKYASWLTGFNGGPLRQPTMKVNSTHMTAIRQALIKSGIEVSNDDDCQFFLGRYQD
ncbi:dihydrodipicolinate synthase family protein [Bacillus sp. ISL-18]|uniref:dihydrodipicolinate synthase family protein n=1 Tax=Bacillus sp. ISL-18 TaxID=2819118 RepID=UPI001BE682CF|nr:dihydrodipicolinate synthase family protein [Bacillus sp. ISL-18]MBT2654974.1 dihydrodipicolinate synthase family protein [Bacillus sp. ISL-18]